MGGCDVPEGGFGLGVDEVVDVFYGEGGFGGVGDLPDDDGADVDGVAVEVVDFDGVGFKVADFDAITDAALETAEELVFRVPEVAALFVDFEAEEIDVKLIPRSSRSGTKIAVPAPGLEDLTVSQGLLRFKAACRR